MLFSVLGQIHINPIGTVITIAVFSASLIIAITIHEFSHALSAALLGDKTAKRLGRLTLHPLAHLDPVGTAMIMLAGFGWGKPTPVNQENLKPGPRPGMAIVALAGPISNVTASIIVSLPINVGLIDNRYVGLSLFHGNFSNLVAYFAGSIVFWNLLLATFNLIPIAPLDGFKIVLGILPRNLANQFTKLERYGPFLLLAIIMMGYIAPSLDMLPKMISPIMNAMIVLVLGGQR
ncbi:site-2 protease family protein [Dehalococcoidia bacterium]|nr:site-2 protease family protein [Dehalococcoidia bacterium]